MSITAIRTRLQTNLSAVQGVTTAYYPAPDAAPPASELPFIIIEKQKPFLSVTAETAGDMVRYTWHFLVKFCFTEAGLDTYGQWNVNIEPYYARIVNKLLGDVKLGQTSSMLVFSPNQKPLDFDEGIVPFLDGQYYGFEIKMDFWEKINTTIS